MDQEKSNVANTSAQDAPVVPPSPNLTEATPETPESNPPANFNPSRKKLLLVVLAVIIVAVVLGGGYFLWQKQQSSNSPTPTPSSSETSVKEEDPTANWKTYTNEKYLYLLKLPEYLNQTKQNRGSTASINNTDWTFAKEDTSKIDSKHKEISQNAIFFEISSFEKNVSEENYNSTCKKDVLTFNIKDPSLTTESKVKGAEKYVEYSGISAYDTTPDTTWWSSNICFMHNGLFYHLGYSNFENQEPDKTFDQILSTFKFIDGEDTTSVSNGVSLENIKYTLPSTWEGKISEDRLLLSANGGGFLSIKVYDYTGDIGRRDFYCRVKDVCIDSSKFTETKIGNIDGYLAEYLDNSGGGNEYFGAKGNKFYIIGTYSPLSPNNFDDNYKQVLNSLVF